MVWSHCEFALICVGSTVRLKSVSVCERVVAGSPSCVNVSGLFALVATDEKCSLCDVLCRGARLACTRNKEWVFPADDVNCSTAADLVSLSS